MKRAAHFLALAALLVLVSSVSAATLDGDYDLSWWTVDGGGGTWSSADEQYELSGTAGQPDARVWEDGDYSLLGGFWSAEVQYRIYLPLVVRD
jgi:hypothetical protein